MKTKGSLLILGLILFFTSCVQNKEDQKNMKYSSAITFLYYEDFSHGIHFVENVLQLNLVMDQGFARVYQVNEKAFLGIVQKEESDEQAGTTLFSLTTNKVEEEYARVKGLEVYELSEIKHFESIPLKSFFFNDKEGHKFEIQQFLKEEDVSTF